MAENQSTSFPQGEPTVGTGPATDEQIGTGEVLHTITEGDLATNPELTEQGVEVGDQVGILPTDPQAGSSQPNPPFPPTSTGTALSPEEGDQAGSEEVPEELKRDTGSLYADGILKRG